MKTFQHVQYASTREYRQALADFKADCLEVVKLGWLAIDDKVLSPVVQVDATSRPDLHDLARVHRSEGAFDTTTSWDFCVKHGATGLARLNVAINSPVRTEFKVIFQMGRHYAYLSDLARNFTFVSIKFDNSPMEDVVSYVMEPQTLKEGLLFYLGGNLAYELKGGR